MVRRDGDLDALLGALARQEPPGIPVERILDRWAALRRRNLAVAGGALVVGLLASVLVLARPEPSERPVYLKLRVVDVSADEVPGDLRALGPQPPELNQP